jgi:hypothetical protein
LDGTITRRDAAGEKKSISSKCAEIDREVMLYTIFRLTERYSTLKDIL